MRQATDRRDLIPWGNLAGLATWCVATLAGVIRDIEPEVILMRSVVAAILVSALTGLIAGIVNLLTRSR